jgi:diadenosine tetraphosphate (Ap4A) HIT family hydrolase/DNA-binding XRE family transcriptional regulator
LCPGGSVTALHFTDTIPLIYGGADWSTVLLNLPVKKDKETARIIGQRIRELRKQRALTQEKLSDLSGIDSKHIQLMEGSDPSNPRIDTVFAICRGLGISISDFFSPVFEDRFKMIQAGNKTADTDLSHKWILREKKDKKDKTILQFSSQEQEKWKNVQKVKKTATERINTDTDKSTELLFHDEWVYSVYDDKPVSRGHINIFFKEKSVSYFQASLPEKHALWAMAEKIKNFLDTKYAPSGYNIGFNLGKVAGQISENFYLEIIPRYSDDLRAGKGIRNIVTDI